jgi:hypothetical protein
MNPILSALACCPPPLSTLSRLCAGGPGHQILAMRTHLPALDHGWVDASSARYVIRINGHLGATLLSAFPAMAWQRHGPETVLTGVLDRPGLYGLLAEIEALGLDLLEIRQLTPEGRSPQRGDTCSP